MSDPRVTFLDDVGTGDTGAALRILGGTMIRVVIGQDAITTFGGQALTYQISTLTARLFDRVELCGEEASCHPYVPGLTGSFLPSLRELLPTLRPMVPSDPTGVTITVAVGRAHVDSADIWLGATAWGAWLSTQTPQDVEDTLISLGALAAGTLGASEVFKRAFSGRLRESHSVPEYSVSLLDYGPIGSKNPGLPEQVDFDLTLFGCGSIGCGFLAALLFVPQASGRLSLVDNGIFDAKNPYKYSLMNWEAGEKQENKALWAKDRVNASAGGRLRAVAFNGTAAQYVASLPVDYAIPLAVSAVDTAEARFEIQDTLPRRIVNAGIDGTLAEVSVHGFVSGPCLACLGMQKALESWDAGGIAGKTGLALGRVYELIRGNMGMILEDITAIRAANLLPGSVVAGLDSYIGQPLLSLWNRIAYGETAVQTESAAPVRVTTAFVSAYAGVLLLAEVLKASVPELTDYLVDNSYRQELLGVPAGDVYRHGRDANGWCLCHSSFRQAVYREKYGDM